MTFSENGFLNFGDRIMMKCEATSSHLACKIQNRIMGMQEGYVAVGSQSGDPTIRSVFVLERGEKDFFTDNIIHYGQKLKLRINPRLTQKTLYLHSSHITPQKCATKSRKQEISFMNDNSINCVWEIEHLDPRVRFESYGVPVKRNEKVLLKHSFTS